jgi:HPt (histidine-containing phosphotransfer) domain-containing protein
MDDYIAKPFHKDQLHAVLRKWLDGRRSYKMKILVNSSDGEGMPCAPLSTNKQSLTESTTASEQLPAQSVIDQKAIDSIRALQEEGKEDLVNKVITIFLNDSPERLKELRKAVHSGDASAINRIAHTLKSSCTNLGALKLSSLFKEMEAMGRANAIERTPQLLSQIDMEFLAVESAMKSELEKKA